jgi:hypothetical protein
VKIAFIGKDLPQSEVPYPAQPADAAAARGGQRAKLFLLKKIFIQRFYPLWY